MTEVEITARRQFNDFLLSHKRWSIAVAHRRAGKTVACVQKLIKGALECDQREPRFAYVAPLYSQAKDVAWSYVKHFAALLNHSGQLNAAISESELRIDLAHNGARVRLYGADNPDRLRGIYLDGCVLDEYADMRPSVWGEIIRPMLADRGGWAAFIGTPKGRNEFHALWEQAQEDPAWYALMLRASETGLLADDELADARRMMTPEQYDQEFECSFEAAIQGAYFGKEIAEAEREGRITEVPYEPELPVHTVWDLGKGANMAVWFFQPHFGQVRVIDHLEGSHDMGIPSCVKAIERKEAEWREIADRDRQPKEPSRWKQGLDYVPHDAKVRELGSERTRVETLIELKRTPRLVPDHHVDDGINAARLTIPVCWFDREHCRDGIEALRQYRAEYDEKVRAFKDYPRHDWTSHTADAFRYLAMAYRLPDLPPGPPEPGRVMAVAPFGQPTVTLEDLWAARPRQSERI